MSYTIYKSDGSLFLTLEDGQLDTSNTSLTLLGKNVINYGQYQTHHLKNPFLTNMEKSKRIVINIDEMLLQKDKTFI
jgi:hypothetical protein